jgi:hypothetical protein
MWVIFGHEGPRTGLSLDSPVFISKIVQTGVGQLRRMRDNAKRRCSRNSVQPIHLEDTIVTRIFVLSGQSLFSRGVEILLRQDQGMELVGEETDVERAIERIKALCPDVVLLEQELPAGDTAPVVMRILNEMPNAKIVGVQLADNMIRVYHGEQRVAREIGDLWEVIKNDPRRDESTSP